MKKFISLVFILILVMQASVTSYAFTDAAANPYTNKKYTHDDTFKNHTISYGVDISQYQSSVDFSAMKKSGIDYVFLRAGYRGYGSTGSLNKDTKFSEYATAATKAGLDIGAYIYSQAITTDEAIEEAKYILNIVKGIDIRLPIVFDFEYAAVGLGRLYNAKLTNRQRTDICLAFCKYVESKGYTAMVYANQSMLTDDLYDEEIAKKYDIWLANYSTAPKYAGKYYDQPYTYWQYTSEGTVKGIKGNVDCNFRYFKKPNTISGLKVSNETTSATTLTWNKQKGCYGYQIFKLDNTTGKYVKIGTNKGASKTSFTDNSSLAVSNTYKVRAISAYKNSFTVGASASVKSDGLFLININNYGTGFATLSWQVCPDATNYQVLRAENPTDQYKVIKTLDSNTTTYTDNVKSGFKTFYYMIRAVVKNSNGKIISNAYTPVKEVIKNQPVLNKVSLMSNSRANIEWTTVKDATGSVVYRSTDGKKFTRLALIENNKTNSFVDKTLKKGIKYYYSVRQYVKVDNKNYYSDYTDNLSVQTLSAPVVKLSIKNNSLKISYNKISGADGYEIYFKTYKGKYECIKTTSKTSYTKNSLPKSKRYYVGVRAYKNVDGKKIFSSFSTKKYI